VRYVLGRDRTGGGQGSGKEARREPHRMETLSFSTSPDLSGGSGATRLQGGGENGSKKKKRGEARGTVERGCIGCGGCGVAITA
jgi:hypothetical protein